MPDFLINPKAHNKIAHFLAGKSIHHTSVPVRVTLDEMEAASLLRKAKRYGFESAIEPAASTPLQKPSKTKPAKVDD